MKGERQRSPDASATVVICSPIAAVSPASPVRSEDSSCAACDGDRPEVCKDCTFDWEVGLQRKRT